MLRKGVFACLFVSLFEGEGKAGSEKELKTFARGYNATNTLYKYRYSESIW